MPELHLPCTPWTKQVRQARLIIGAHGGAMANMVLAQSDAGAWAPISEEVELEVGR